MAQSIPNTSVRQRMAQVIVLMILIFAGMMFSQTAEAQRPGRKGKSSKTMRIASRNNSSKACYELYKKRTTTQNRATFSSARTRKPKYKPMAETDQPMGVASLN